MESIDNNAGDDAQDTDIIENEKKFDSKKALVEAVKKEADKKIEDIL